MNWRFHWERGKPWVRRINVWLMLAPLVSVVAVICAHWLEWRWFLSKPLHEGLAIVLVSVSFVTVLVRVRRGHGPFFVLLSFLVGSLLFREIHYPGTGKTIYVCLVVTLIWGIYWRDRIAPPLREGPSFPWLFATLFTYFFSQLIARRVFRGMPNEALLHVPLEEVTETMGHLMLIVTSLVGSWKRWPRG